MKVTRMIAMLVACVAAFQVGATEVDVFAHPKSAGELTQALLAEPARAIAHTHVLRGKFIHRKHLRDIPAPLESSGEFVFLRDAGLYWHTVKPFDSVFVLTPNAMTQRDEGGAALKMNAAEQPAVRAAARIFMSLFAVDVKALEGEFHMFGVAVEGGWRLGLRPKNSAMSALFTQAIVSGATQVREVELQDAYGDRTVIQLHGTELLNRAPTAAEHALISQR